MTSSASCEFWPSDFPPAHETARKVLEPYFRAAVERFIAGGAKRVEKVRLEVNAVVHDTPRHFAATEDTGLRVLVAPLLAEWPEETVTGILLHELGHAVDFLYPGEFFLTDDGLRRIEGDVDEKHSRKARVERMRIWRDRDSDTVELTADRIAERYTGLRIGYAGPCVLQTIDGGRPRPQGLR